MLAGEFRGVIREARRRGIDEVMRRESPANLMALADAARYAGGSRLATRALTQVRGRFPDSSPAHRAAFLLGRLAEDKDGDSGQRRSTGIASTWLMPTAIPAPMPFAPRRWGGR